MSGGFYTRHFRAHADIGVRTLLIVDIGLITTGLFVRCIMISGRTGIRLNGKLAQVTTTDPQAKRR
jgi:hypothetical protein